MAIKSAGTEDQAFDQDGARVLLGVKSILHLNGTELDYQDDSMQSEFVFNNPSVKGICGCGASFSA